MRTKECGLENAIQAIPQPRATSILIVYHISGKEGYQYPWKLVHLPYLGIFQVKFASKSPEELVSEMGAWTPHPQILVSRTELVSGHLDLQ